MESEDRDVKDGEYGLYEVGFLILPTVAEDAVEAEVSHINEILSKHAGAVKASERPTLRTLLYTMSKHASGKNTHFSTAYFGSVTFEATAQAIIEIKNEIEKIPTILRFLLIETVPEALMPRERKVMGKIEPEKFRPEKGATPVTPISEAELDKTIEALIAE
jgi:ribosomal protein S6